MEIIEINLFQKNKDPWLALRDLDFSKNNATSWHCLRFPRIQLQNKIASNKYGLTSFAIQADYPWLLGFQNELYKLGVICETPNTPDNSHLNAMIVYLPE